MTTISMVCAPSPSGTLQLAVPVVGSPFISATGSGPHSVALPSLKVTVALRMSPAWVSPEPGTAALSRTVTRKRPSRVLPPEGVKASMSPV